MNKISVLIGDTLNDGKTKTAQGFIPLGVLIDKKVIESYDPDNKESSGYQRMLEKLRVNKLFVLLRDKIVDVPTSIFINVRDFSSSNLKVQSGIFATLDIAKSKLAIVDGHHRLEAYIKVYDEDPKRWEDKLVPVDMVLGASTERELAFFHEINGNTKGISAGYLQEILSKRNKIDSNFVKNQMETKDHWKIEADEIMKNLEKSSKVWKGKIKYPSSPQGIIPNSGFINSLKPLYKNEWFGSFIDQDARIELLKAFWEGAYQHFEDKTIPQNMDQPNPFDLDEKGKSVFAIQKAVGVGVLLRMVMPIKYRMEKLKDIENPYLDPKIWKAQLAPVLNYTGENSHGDEVSGPLFWMAGKEGGIGKYSSEAGKADLVASLLSELKKQDVS